MSFQRTHPQEVGEADEFSCERVAEVTRPAEAEPVEDGIGGFPPGG